MSDDDYIPYLILHKVRGEPAFDIATKLMFGDEEGWIIPTSGHRAYPVACYRLHASGLDGFVTEILNDGKDQIPTDWPDHYRVKGEAKPNLRQRIAHLLPQPKPFSKRSI